MLEEGREAIFARHKQAGDYVRDRARAMGLQLLANHPYASNTISAILVPEGTEAKAVLKKLREDDKVVLAGGQGQLDGKIFRIGHLGYFEQKDLADALDRLEARLVESGYRK
ncbi:MAG TPA: alanine--glyoxylate aminotransferase family protein, partial [Ktedonobacteraceae bacterium]|nr:alanine--glyoxylate aminotransferase family protein [Ktedonobacteraceae bacterium]